MKTVALYTRVSTQEQSAEGYSLGEQEERLRLYAKAHDWTVVAVYTDPGYSGAKLERPSIQKLIRDCEKKSFDAVLIYKLDRLSRSQKDTLYLIEDVFNKNEIGLVSMRENFDTQTPFGKAMIGILSVFAQLERDQITERMNMGRLGRAKAGYYSGGSCPPIGYTYTSADGDDKHTLQIDEYEAMQVRKVFDLFNNGLNGKPMTFTAIRTYMHERYKTRYGTWTATSTVTNMLSDPVYIGCVSFGGKYYHGIHEPIISKETYDIAMQCMEQRKTTRTNNSEHLLTGLIYCGKCGAKMRYQKWGNKGCKLICYSQQKSKKYLIKDPDCDQEKIWADEIEGYVVNALFQFADNYEPSKTESLIEKDKLTLLYNQKNELSKKLKRLYNIYAEQDDDMLLETISDVKKQLDSVNKKIEQNIQNNTEEKQRKEKIGILRNLSSIWNDITANEKKTIIRKLVDKIVITDNHVHINFSI